MSEVVVSPKTRWAGCADFFGRIVDEAGGTRTLFTSAALLGTGIHLSIPVSVFCVFLIFFPALIGMTYGVLLPVNEFLEVGGPPPLPAPLAFLKLRGRQPAINPPQWVEDSLRKLLSGQILKLG